MSKFVKGDFVKHTRIGVIGHIDDNGVCLVTFADDKDMIKEDELVAIKAIGSKTDISIESLRKWIDDHEMSADERLARGYNSALFDLFEFIEKEERNEFSNGGF